MYTTPHVLSLLKGFVCNFDFNDKDLLNITLNPLLLTSKVNIIFALSFENTAHKRVRTKCYLPAVQIKDYNVMIDGQNVFDQPLKNDLRTYANIPKIEIGQGVDCATGCLLDYNYFNKYNKMIAMDLTKQQALDADPKGIKQYNFIENLNRGENINDHTTVFFIFEEAKETILNFSQGTVRVYFVLIISI